MYILRGTVCVASCVTLYEIRKQEREKEPFQHEREQEKKYMPGCLDGRCRPVNGCGRVWRRRRWRIGGLAVAVGCGTVVGDGSG